MRFKKMRVYRMMKLSGFWRRFDCDIIKIFATKVGKAISNPFIDYQDRSM